MSDLKFAVIIPARYKSTRLPGKPLIDLVGKSMINRVWERCVQAVGVDNVYIATDDLRILDACALFTDNVIMTSEECLTGTDRVYEAAMKIGGLDFVVNVQGDEPLIDPLNIQKIINGYTSSPGVIVNGMAQIESQQEFFSSTIPKVVFRPDGRLLYMSRAGIPSNKTHGFTSAWKQICIYAFPLNTLAQFSLAKEKTCFENIEDIEILRFLEMGNDVNMIEVDASSIAVDTEADANKVRLLLE